MKLLVAALLTGLASGARAQEKFKLLLVADQASAARAQEYKDYMLRTPPFDSVADQLDVKIQVLSDDELKCGPGRRIVRLLECDTQRVAREKAGQGAHMAAVFTSKGSGGSGGQIPIASKDYPLGTMLHEMLHAFGLDDEYSYDPEEVDTYCSPPSSGPNIAVLAPLGSYVSKAHAMSTHGKDIEWSGDIEAPTPVTHEQQLGTPPLQQHREKAGLYEGGNCSMATRALGARRVYRPYFASIMKHVSTGSAGVYPLYQRRILQGMAGLLGRPLVPRAVVRPQVPPQEDIKQQQESKADCLESSIRVPQTPVELSYDIDHIFQHFLNPHDPHPGHTHGQ